MRLSQTKFDYDYTNTNQRVNGERFIKSLSKQKVNIKSVGGFRKAAHALALPLGTLIILHDLWHWRHFQIAIKAVQELTCIQHQQKPILRFLCTWWWPSRSIKSGSHEIQTKPQFPSHATRLLHSTPAAPSGHLQC